MTGYNFKPFAFANPNIDMARLNFDPIALFAWLDEFKTDPSTARLLVFSDWLEEQQDRRAPRVREIAKVASGDLRSVFTWLLMLFTRECEACGGRSCEECDRRGVVVTPDDFILEMTIATRDKTVRLPHPLDR